jgi:hypothetical protein
MVVHKNQPKNVILPKELISKIPNHTKTADNNQANDVIQFFTEYTSTERYKNFETAENKHEAVILGKNQQEEATENGKQALLNSDYYTKPNQFGLTQAFLDEANRQSQEELSITKGHSI